MAVAAVPLAFLVLYLLRKGAGVVDWNFLTDDIPISSRLAIPPNTPMRMQTAWAFQPSR